MKKKTEKKKKSGKRSEPKKTAALAIVSYSDIVQPEMHRGKLSLLASYFPKKTIEFITRPTPKRYILQREGTSNKKFDYIPGWYAKKCANYAFGFNHSFEIKNKSIVGLSAIVEGRLIVNDPKTGKQIFFKDDIGGHQIRFLKDKAKTPENAVDIGNDYKSAATDALKRCMVQIGFFSDVYGVNEARDDGNFANPEPSGVPQLPPAPQSPEDVVECHGARKGGCPHSAEITRQQADFSKKVYGKPLCPPCQKESKPRK